MVGTMKLSSKSRHAVAAMIDLGIKSMARPVALVDILDDQDISLSYLEQIFGRLKDHRLVVGIRGPRGGYRLARDPDQITIAQIVAAVEDISPRGRKSRIDGKKSDAHYLWDALSGRVMDFLEAQTLAQYLDKVNVTEFARRNTGRFHNPEHFTRRRAA